MADPARPIPVSRLWLPGMNLQAGEAPCWDPKHRYALHHAIVKEDLACGAWRDGGMTTIDVSDRHHPRCTWKFLSTICRRHAQRPAAN